MFLALPLVSCKAAPWYYVFPVFGYAGSEGASLSILQDAGERVKSWKLPPGRKFPLDSVGKGWENVINSGNTFCKECCSDGDGNSGAGNTPSPAATSHREFSEGIPTSQRKFWPSQRPKQHPRGTSHLVLLWIQSWLEGGLIKAPKGGS